MQMTAADLAFMKGEAAVQEGDGKAQALKRATEQGYLVPNEAREAFVAGFISVCRDESE